MTDWKVAMLCLLPFIMAVGISHIDGRKVRVWLALMLTALLAPLWWHPVWFLAIDGIATALVLRHPRGACQRLIGGIFLIMVCMDGGFFIAETIYNTTDRIHFADMMRHMGWAQWSILAIWCGYDFLGRFGYIRDWRDYSLHSEAALARSAER